MGVEGIGHDKWGERAVGNGGWAVGVRQGMEGEWSWGVGGSMMATRSMSEDTAQPEKEQEGEPGSGGSASEIAALDERVAALLEDVDSTVEAVSSAMGTGAEEPAAGGEPFEDFESMFATGDSVLGIEPAVVAGAGGADVAGANAVMEEVGRELGERAGEVGAARGEPEPESARGPESAPEPESQHQPEPVVEASAGGGEHPAVIERLDAALAERAEQSLKEEQERVGAGAANVTVVSATAPEPVVDARAETNEEAVPEALAVPVPVVSTPVVQDVAPRAAPERGSAEIKPVGGGVVARAPVNGARDADIGAAMVMGLGGGGGGGAGSAKAAPVAGVGGAGGSGLGARVRGAASLVGRSAGRVGGAAMVPLARLSRVTGRMSVGVRQTIGYAAVLTLLMAVGLWGFLMMRGPSKLPEATSEPAVFLKAGDHAPEKHGGGGGGGGGESHGGSAPAKKDEGHGAPAKKKDDGHGAPAKKKDDGHGAPAKKKEPVKKAGAAKKKGAEEAKGGGH